MKFKVILFSLTFFALSAQAKVYHVVCFPNEAATVSQFRAVADVEVDDDNSVTGTFDYSLRISKSQETSAVESVKVDGKMHVIPAGKLTKNKITSFELKAESDDQEILIHLNSGMPTPRASTMLIDRKNRFASECEIR